MSPKSSPWWNGSQESFFGPFKVEFGDVDRFENLPNLVEALYRQLHYHWNLRIKNPRDGSGTVPGGMGATRMNLPRTPLCALRFALAR